MTQQRFKSHRVQAEYEKFLAGERNHYSALFIDRVIPKPHRFHQPFDLYVKLTLPEQHGGPPIADGQQDYTKLNEYLIDGEWRFPNRRRLHNCNDICWGCGRWCVKLEGVTKFYPYVCLAGQFRDGNRHPKIPDPPELRDPIEPKYATPAYPFLCWDCYLYKYKPFTLIRFFGEVYVVDHAFIMNRDKYDPRGGPRLRKRIFNRNAKWSKLKDIPLKLLANLNNEGRFVLHEVQRDGDCEVSCALCGDAITTQERGFYIEGRTKMGVYHWWLPVMNYVNGELDKRKADYIYSCYDCYGEKERKFYYPFGFKFEVVDTSHINK